MSSVESSSDGTTGTAAVTGSGNDGVAVHDGVAVVQLAGELDLAMVPSVRDRLVGLDGDVKFDCAALTFIDSAGINLFVEIHQACVGRGSTLTIVNAGRPVARLLALTGVDQLFDVRTEDSVA